MIEVAKQEESNSASLQGVIYVRFKEQAYEQEVIRMLSLFYPHMQVKVLESSAIEKTTDQDVMVHVNIKSSPDTIYAIVSVETLAAVKGVDRSRSLYQCKSRLLILPEHATDVQIRRATKRAMVYALHEALAAYTGTSQPWGILTGVRPGKLVHDLLLHKPLAPTWSEVVHQLQSNYRIDAVRSQLLTDIAKRELMVVPDLYSLKQREVSIYIGIPFCPTHCAYCTFPAYSMVDKARYAEGFLDAMMREIEMVGRLLREYKVPVTTVYIGGGTPTSLKAKELSELLESVVTKIPGHKAWREFCVEAGRADTITKDRVDVLKTYGVDRVSVNPQTFRAQTLKLIGRGHSPDIVDKRFHLFREASFQNINMDLILGLPGESLSDVQYSLERTLQLEPDAITVHTLSFKRASEVTDHRDAYAVAKDSEVYDMMDYVARQMKVANYVPYYLYRQKDILANLENVGYSLPGKEGIYNMITIEEMQTIVGIGGGASSKWVMPDGTITQQQNASEPSAYIAHMEQMLEKKERALHRVLSAIQSFGHLS